MKGNITFALLRNRRKLNLKAISLKFRQKWTKWCGSSVPRKNGIKCEQKQNGAVAQLVEQKTENLCVGGSKPSHTTTNPYKHWVCRGFLFAVVGLVVGFNKLYLDFWLLIYPFNSANQKNHFSKCSELPIHTFILSSGYMLAKKRKLPPYRSH